MPGNALGQRFVVLSFGESHGRCVGVVVDGCPAGLAISREEIQQELDLRRPGTSIVTTTRVEPDQVDIFAGVFNGHTTGAPILMLIFNTDKDSRSYELLRNKPRPSHADYVARQKYGGFNDYRGGGRFSGRITAGYVMAGALAKKLLQQTLGVRIIAYTKRVGDIEAGPFTLDQAEARRYTNEVRCPDADAAERMKQRIVEERGRGDSLGGIVECVAINMPVGVGEPVFDNLDSDLSKALFSIPAVKGVEFGAGFAGTTMRGSEHNDPYYWEGGVLGTRSNNAGGIIGGLSSGMPVMMRVAFKPAASIALEQDTVDLETCENTRIIVAGRHDPCVVPRAVPVVESVAAIVLADHALRAGLIPPVLSTEVRSR